MGDAADMAFDASFDESFDDDFDGDRPRPRRRPEPTTELLKVVQVIRETDNAWELLLACGLRGYFPRSVCRVAEANGATWLHCPTWLWEKKRKVLDSVFSERYAAARHGVTWQRNYGKVGGG